MPPKMVSIKLALRQVGMTEAFVTEQAVEEFNQLTNEALNAVKRGEKSPLFYYMYRYRFDLPALAQTTGLWQWQIKRHFKPSIFDKLSDNILAKYAEAFGVSTSTLKTSK